LEKGARKAPRFPGAFSLADEALAPDMTKKRHGRRGINCGTRPAMPSTLHERPLWHAVEVHLSADLIRRRYNEAHGANPGLGYRCTLHVGREDEARAALGYRRADDTPLFLEAYLDLPVEQLLGATFGRPVARQDVIEIGNLASEDAFAMVALWGQAANDLGAMGEIAVATLTAPLRRMFARMGVPLKVLAPALATRVADSAAWGRYYDTDPRVCAGVIAEGQAAIARFLARRERAA